MFARVGRLGLALTAAGIGATLVLAPAAPAPAAPGCIPAQAVGDDGYAHPLPGQPGADLPACASPAGDAARVAPSPESPPRRHRVCRVRWIPGRDAHGRWTRRPGHRGRWHTTRVCRWERG